MLLYLIIQNFEIINQDENYIFHAFCKQINVTANQIYTYFINVGHATIQKLINEEVIGPYYNHGIIAYEAVQIFFDDRYCIHYKSVAFHFQNACS